MVLFEWVRKFCLKRPSLTPEIPSSVISSLGSNIFLLLRCFSFFLRNSNFKTSSLEWKYLKKSSPLYQERKDGGPIKLWTERKKVGRREGGWRAGLWENLPTLQSFGTKSDMGWDIFRISQILVEYLLQIFPPQHLKHLAMLPGHFQYRFQPWQLCIASLTLPLTPPN